MPGAGTPAPARAAICILAVAVSAAAAGPPDAARGEAYYSYCLSQQAWYRQDYQEALQYLQEAARADPNSVELTLDLARLDLDLNQPEEAAKAARQAIGMAPSSAAPQRVLADALFMIAMRESAGRDAIEQACEAYERAIQLDPGDADALLSLAKLQISKGDLKGSAESLQRHHQLSPLSEEGIYLSSQVLTKLGRFSQASELLESAVQRNPENAQLGLALVDVYEAEGDLDAASAAARRLLKLRVDPVRVRFVLARLNQKSGKPDEAFVDFEEMSRLMDGRPSEFSEGDRAEVRLRMVQCLLDAGRFEDALSEADGGIQRFAADPRFVLRKGETLLMGGRIADAETLFRQSLKGSGGGRAGRGSYAQQISDTYLSAGARQERGGRLGEAETLLKKSIGWNAKNASALNYLGYMLADRGTRLDEAVGYIRKALAQDPNNGAYLDSLGWAYFKRQEYVEAETLLKRALASMEEEPAIHEHLGDVYSATGRKEEAIRAWREALDRGAENPDQIRAKLAATGAALAAP